MKTISLIIFTYLLFAKSFLVYSQDLQKSLTDELKNHYEQSDLPGFAVAILSKDKVLYQQGFGYADLKQKTPFTPNTLMNLGSVSKTVVGVALVKVIEDGKLSMDTPINDILPFKIVNPYHEDKAILIRHLANHTSSLLDSKYYGQTYILGERPINKGEVHPGYLDFISEHEVLTLEAFIKKIFTREGKWYKKKNFLKSPPGLGKAYSNINAALAAYLVELATGVSFKEYTRAKITQPLGMSHSGWSPKDITSEEYATGYFPSGLAVPSYSLITYPDGGFISNVADMSLYLKEMIKAYDGKSAYLNDIFRKMLLPGDEDKNRVFWGMGEKSRNIGHAGSDPGVQTDIQFNADSKIGRVIFSNVNAEDNEELWQQYRKIHEILRKYEEKLK